MSFKRPAPARSLLKTTKFWKENYLILREFRHFRKVTSLAVGLSFLAAIFEPVNIGFLLSFLQRLTSPDAKPIQPGIGWIDILALGVNTSATSWLY
jgi:ATP-binding cassette, subfamily B, bacterial MsbA